MDERIIVYGNSDEEQFSNPEQLVDYIARGVFDNNFGRYRYTQCKEADIIVMSHKGVAYGHFMIEGKTEVTNDDRLAFPPVKCVYLVDTSVVYENPVRLFAELGIRVTAFGTPITKEQFEEIQNKAGTTTAFSL